MSERRSSCEWCPSTDRVEFDFFARTHAPTPSVIDGLRADAGPDPILLRSLTNTSSINERWRKRAFGLSSWNHSMFPDAVFVEDAALCIGSHATVLRPGAPTRAGEADAIVADLEERFATVARVEEGFVDGGDILVTASEIWLGFPLAPTTPGPKPFERRSPRRGSRCASWRHRPGCFKTDCAVVDDATIFSTARLAASGCFDGYTVIECPAGEEARPT